MDLVFYKNTFTLQEDSEKMVFAFYKRTEATRFAEFLLDLRTQVLKMPYHSEFTKNCVPITTLKKSYITETKEVITFLVRLNRTVTICREKSSENITVEIDKLWDLVEYMAIHFRLPITLMSDI